MQRRIVEQIRDLHRRRLPLNISAVRESHPALLLAVYQVKPFWGWKAALEAAGLDYSKIRCHLSALVKCKICGRRMSCLGKHLSKVHHVSVRDYKVEFHGAPLSSPASNAKRPGPVRFIIPHWERNWTPEYLLDRVHELHRLGIPLYPTNIEVSEKTTYRWAHVFFGGWDTVLRAIGLDPLVVRKAPPMKFWTKEDVIKAIKQRYRKGYAVNRNAMAKFDRSLNRAADHLFRGYDNALRASGLNPDRIRLCPRSPHRCRTKEDVKVAIQLREIRGLPIFDYGLSHGKNRDLSLWNKARRLFGSWRAAVTEAGYDYDKITTSRTIRYKTEADIVEAIRKRHRAGLPLQSATIRKGPDKDTHLYKRAYIYFKDWMTAIAAAGIDYKSVLRNRRRYPTEESVLQEIRRRADLGMPMTYSALRKSADGKSVDGALYDSGLRFFGNWATAFKKAGLASQVKHPQGRYPTKKDVLAGIRQRHRDGLTLRHHAMLRPHADRALYVKARKFFVTWGAAVEAAGVDYAVVCKQRRKYPSADAVIAEIRRRQEAGLPIRGTGFTLGPQRDPALHSTAKKDFGDWRKALEAAGVN
ncbi:MAG: hypothetical protein WCP86_03060 [bacterium]